MSATSSDSSNRNSPAPLTGTRRRSKRSEATKDQVIEAAAKVFADSGYESASLDTVAGEAGLTKGTLYYHFDSKEAIYAAVLLRYLGDAHDRLVKFAAKDIPLTSIIEAIVDDQITDTMQPETRYIHYQELLRVHADTREVVRGAQRRYERALASVLERGQREGVVIDGDARVLALMLIGAIGRVSRWYRPQGRIPADEMRATIKRLILHGLFCDTSAVK